MILASNSAGRRAMLTDAGVIHEAIGSGVDEESAKASMLAEALNARDLADALAELKARRVSGRFPRELVLGCDSVVALEDGTLLDKPADRADAIRQLHFLSGRPHRLYSAAVIAEGGQPVWRFVDKAVLHVRPLTDVFIETYLDAEYEQARHCVGCYRVEGPGAQLFSRIEGSHFTVIGLPLLPLLAYLRTRGVMTS